MSDLINGSNARLTQGHVETLRAAVQGFLMEHGVYPDFILMSDDVARAVFREVEQNRAKYGSLVKINGALQPMMLNFGPDGGIEIGQIIGVNRVELAVDANVFKAKRSMGVA